jgi:hypothetical protein
MVRSLGCGLLLKHALSLLGDEDASCDPDVKNVESMSVDEFADKRPRHLVLHSVVVTNVELLKQVCSSSIQRFVLVVSPTMDKRHLHALIHSASEL